MAVVDYTGLVSGQRDYFHSGATRPVRMEAPAAGSPESLAGGKPRSLLRRAPSGHPAQRTDADLMDVEYSINEAEYALKHLHHWMKPEREPTPLLMEPGHVRVRRDPLGVTLIIGAWNEPFMLTLAPLVAAIAAGNTAVIKPSEIAEATAAQIAELVPKYLDTEAVAVVLGGVPETTALLDQHWDLIFFTGSPPVGKIVHQAAAQHLTPAVLELGGKNPTIVHSSANVRSAARRIAYGRFVNAGQICTAPDHVLVWPEVKDELVAELKQAVRDFYGDDPQQSPDYGRIINSRNFDRLAGLLAGQRDHRGGRADRSGRPLHRADGAGRRASGLAGHAGGGIRPDPAGAGDRLRRGGHRLGQRRPAAAGPVCLRRGRGRRRADPRATDSGDAGVNDCIVHPLVRNCRSAESATPAWASITATGDSRPSPTPAACCTTAR